MKRKLCCLLMALLFVFAAAHAEEENVTLYEVRYDEALLTGWYVSAYPYPETLLYANEDENQVLVLLLDKEDYPDAGLYIEECYESAQEYANVSDYTGLEDWESSLGAGAKASYVAGFEDGVFTESLYVTSYKEYLLVTWFTLMGQNAEWADQFAGSFLNTLSINEIAADSWQTGYVRAAKAEDGQVELTIDFVRFVWGEDQFDYTIEDDGQAEVRIRIHPQAQVYIPNAADFSELMHLSDAASIVAAIEEGLKLSGDLLFDVGVKDGQIIWMDYCYVV